MSKEGEIAVDFATLQELAEEMESILSELTTQLEGLYDRTEKVVLSWEGEARDMFVSTLDRWDNSAQELEAAERWLRQVVINGNTNYQSAHQAVLRGWGGS